MLRKLIYNFYPEHLNNEATYKETLTKINHSRLDKIKQYIIEYEENINKEFGTTNDFWINFYNELLTPDKLDLKEEFKVSDAKFSKKGHKSRTYKLVLNGQAPGTPDGKSATIDESYPGLEPELIKLFHSGLFRSVRRWASEGIQSVKNSNEFRSWIKRKYGRQARGKKSKKKSAKSRKSRKGKQPKKRTLRR